MLQLKDIIEEWRKHHNDMDFTVYLQVFFVVCYGEDLSFLGYRRKTE